MLRNHKLRLAAVGAAITAAAAALPGAAANAAAAGPEQPLVAHTAALPKITITMNGKKITVSGALQSGGVQIESKVTREPQGDPALIRLDPGVTVAQFLKAAAGDPNNVALIASIVFSPQANKGTSSAQAHLAPGRYVAADLASNAKTPPLTTFTIAKAASPAKLPKPQATIASIDFGFRQRLATGFYAFDNALTHGAYQQQVIRNRPGYWVLACFMDTQDHREHTQLGMERVIRIVR